MHLVTVDMYLKKHDNVQFIIRIHNEIYTSEYRFYQQGYTSEYRFYQQGHLEEVSVCLSPSFSEKPRPLFD